MSYTLKGRLESRVTAALLPLLAACILAAVLPAWWPVELAALMIGAGLALDLLYDRLLEYQPGWLALPLGVLELAVIMGLVRLFGIADEGQRAMPRGDGAERADRRGQVGGLADRTARRVGHGEPARAAPDEELRQATTAPVVLKDVALRDPAGGLLEPRPARRLEEVRAARRFHERVPFPRPLGRGHGSQAASFLNLGLRPKTRSGLVEFGRRGKAAPPHAASFPGVASSFPGSSRAVKVHSG